MTAEEYGRVLGILFQAQREVGVRAISDKRNKGYEYGEKLLKNLIDSMNMEILPLVVGVVRDRVVTVVLLMIVPLGALLRGGQ